MLASCGHQVRLAFVFVLVILIVMSVSTAGKLAAGANYATCGTGYLTGHLHRLTIIYYMSMVPYVCSRAAYACYAARRGCLRAVCGRLRMLRTIARNAHLLRARMACAAISGRTALGESCGMAFRVCVIVRRVRLWVGVGFWRLVSGRFRRVSCVARRLVCSASLCPRLLYTSLAC